MKNLNETPEAVTGLTQDELVVIDGEVFITGYATLSGVSNIFFTKGEEHTDNYNGRESDGPPTLHVRNCEFKAAIPPLEMVYLISSREYTVK